MISIYYLKDPRDDFNPRYIGITKQPINQRLWQHIRDSNKFNYHSSNWILTLLKSNVKPVIVLIDEFETWKEAQECEIGLISKWKEKYKLTNITSGGEGACGAIRTDAMKKRISNANMGNLYWLGKTHTEESKLKIGLASSKRRSTSESRQKTSDSCKGHIVSTKTREKLSKTHKGVPKRTTICPYCQKEGGIGNMKRYHFENCKFK